MRFTDLMMAFPALLLAIVPGGGVRAQPVDRRHGDRAGQLGAGGPHRLHRDARPLAERDFIMAERSLGAGTPRILFRTSCRI
jgi:peptide/nickel transport system permease protein